jgi:integrative and conjugative element protein (TIGR02256 family)
MRDLRREVVLRWTAADCPHLALSRGAYDHLSAHRQDRWWKFEAGGPLFSVTEGAAEVIIAAAGPFDRDRRGPRSFVPHRPSTQAEIDARHARGQHFIGTWHTHPSATPTPSGTDLGTMTRLFRGSTHGPAKFVMIIVGTDPSSATWHASVHDMSGWTRCKRPA